MGGAARRGAARSLAHLLAKVLALAQRAQHGLLVPHARHHLHLARGDEVEVVRLVALLEDDVAVLVVHLRQLGHHRVVVLVAQLARRRVQRRVGDDQRELRLGEVALPHLLHRGAQVLLRDVALLVAVEDREGVGHHL